MRLLAAIANFHRVFNRLCIDLQRHSEVKSTLVSAFGDFYLEAYLTNDTAICWSIGVWPGGESGLEGQSVEVRCEWNGKDRYGPITVAEPVELPVSDDENLILRLNEAIELVADSVQLFDFRPYAADF
jgi:hypothetical protein